MNRRRALAVAVGLAALPVLTACGGGEEDEDCDAEDLRNKEDECGYYDEHGTFVLFPWIVAGKGGKPPKGQKAKPPAGVKQNPPKPANPPRQPARNNPAPARRR